ncbi:MAG: DTW domain-containing protein [Piptocephalis tieghemiana]|nr:MAG: DTW domain-containing protein [Piptocephalis tieghemiana]
MSSLHTNPDPVLGGMTKRIKCPTCKQSILYFCYHCVKLVGLEPEKVPNVSLPVSLDIIKHEKELDSKSTAIHAKLLAPADTTIHSFPSDYPEYPKDGSTLLLFPTEGAKTLDQVDTSKFKRLVVIDGTWRQAKTMCRLSPSLDRLPKVKIAEQKTTFWRFQNLDEHYLATIEAIYHFYREYHLSLYHQPTHQYDDLLFFYKFFYDRIQREYRSQPEKPFCHRHRPGYIQYEGEGKEMEEKKEEDNAEKEGTKD